jgi:hypothetical protein
LETRTVAGTSLSGEFDATYTSTDSTCTGTKTAGTTFTGTLSNVIDFTVKGWSDNNSIVAAPAAQDGTTTIEATPVATLMDVTLSFAGGTPETGKFLHFVDDTDATAGILLYRSTGNPAATCDPDGSGSEQCLQTSDFLTKQ